MDTLKEQLLKEKGLHTHTDSLVEVKIGDSVSWMYCMGFDGNNTFNGCTLYIDNIDDAVAEWKRWNGGFKMQCCNCGELMPMEDVIRLEHTDDITTLFHCTVECEIKEGVKEWLIAFPGQFKKLDKFIQENPEP